MKTNEIICSMCGTHFDPAKNTACSTCPLQPGCQVVCCPACGFETVDPSRSRLARLASRLFQRRGTTNDEA